MEKYLVKSPKISIFAPRKKSNKQHNMKTKYIALAFGAMLVCGGAMAQKKQPVQ